MASFNKVNSFAGALANGQVNLGSDAVKCALTNTSPTSSWATYSGDVAGVELANGNGYTTGGAAVASVADTDAAGTVTLAGTGPTWTATGSMGPFRYVVVYDSTTGKIIGWYDYGSAVTLAATQTFQVSFPSGIFTLS